MRSNIQPLIMGQNLLTVRPESSICKKILSQHSPRFFGKHVLKLAEEDPKIVAITPAMPVGSCLDAFMKRFPDRCIDVGIAEGHSVAFSGGISHGGKLKVIACVYSTFLQRAFDNIYHDVCVQKAPMVFAIDRAGLAFGDGVTAQGLYDHQLPQCHAKHGHHTTSQWS